MKNGTKSTFRMPLKMNKTEWSLATMWSYLISVTIVYCALPIFKLVSSAIFQVPFEYQNYLSVGAWAIYLLMFLPVILTTKKNKTRTRSIFFSFLLYCVLAFSFIMTFSILLKSYGTVFWSGIFNVGLIAATCSYLMILIEKRFLKYNS